MIRLLTNRDVNTVSSIHFNALKGDFFPSLGMNFLKTFYEGAIGKKEVYALGFFKNDKLHGFIIGTNNSSSFFREIFKSRFLVLTIIVFKQLIKRPYLIQKILETFLYTNKVKGPKAELVVIAVDKIFQGKGVGKLLVNALEKEFRSDGIRRYKLTVHANKNAVGFYDYLDFSRSGTFSLYGKMWYIYEKAIQRR